MMSRRAGSGHTAEMPEAENDDVHDYLFARFVDPAVALEPAQCANDALLDRELGRPASGLNFFRVEEDEGIVADPAAIAAGVIETRFQAERSADYADAVVDLHVFRRAEIVDLRVLL